MRHLYPIITTPFVSECRDFYVKGLDAKVIFENDWYVHLSIDGWEIGFLLPDPPARVPVFRHAVPSRSLCVAMEVEDVRKYCELLKARGLLLLGDLETYSGGEVGFAITDPAGVVINIVERADDPTANFDPEASSFQLE